MTFRQLWLECLRNGPSCGAGVCRTQIRHLTRVNKLIRHLLIKRHCTHEDTWVSKWKIILFSTVRSVLFLVLLASGGYLLYHHTIITSNPSTRPSEGSSSTCDCSTAPPPPCECNNTTTEADEEMESISNNTRRPSFNLQINCPTPPPAVDRQVMLSLSIHNTMKVPPFPREAQAVGASTYSTLRHRTRLLTQEWTATLNQIQSKSFFAKRTISNSSFPNIVNIFIKDELVADGVYFYIFLWQENLNWRGGPEHHKISRFPTLERKVYLHWMWTVF